MNYKLWLYGNPFSGKSHFADTFPKAFVINTDGNLQFYKNADGIQVKNYEEFVQALGKFDTEKYDTLIIDLVDHVYDMCREEFLNENGIEHETDYQGDGAWGKGWTLLRDQFWYMISKIRNINSNVILISHLDEKEVKGKMGQTRIDYSPATIPKKLSNKIMGIMHFVGRNFKDGGEFKVSFGIEDLELSGERYKLKSREIGNTYDEFEENIIKE